MTTDFSELDDLARDLTAVIQVTAPKVDGASPFLAKAVEHAAVIAKRGWVADAKRQSGTRLKAYPHSIDYVIEPEKSGGTRAVVGPNPKRAQGRFAAAEDAPGGWRRLGARPQHASREPALKAEKDLKKGVRIAIDDALKARNL